MRTLLLLSIFISCSVFAKSYSRAEFGAGWIDADNDCQDTRVEVLIEESIIPPVMDSKNCYVKSGIWLDRYSGEIVRDPSKLDIDHVVPLKEAWLTGADHWTRDKRVHYANYLIDKNHLMAVSKSTNRSKGGKTPEYWIPPNIVFLGEYLSMWVGIKTQWGLAIPETDSISALYVFYNFHKRGFNPPELNN